MLVVFPDKQIRYATSTFKAVSLLSSGPCTFSAFPGMTRSAWSISRWSHKSIAACLANDKHMILCHIQPLFPNLIQMYGKKLVENEIKC